VLCLDGAWSIGVEGEGRGKLGSLGSLFGEMLTIGEREGEDLGRAPFEELNQGRVRALFKGTLTLDVFRV
jgi:hypothetical protein